MRNDKFWNECTAGSIRQKVAEFIDKSPVLSKLKGESYYDMEDALVEFIETNSGLIADEVDREYHRDDLVNQATMDCGENAAQILSVIPIEKIDDIVDSWQEALGDDDTYWEATWDDLSNVLSEIPIFGNIEDLDKNDTIIYMAYLKEWYSSHDALYEEPATANEFFNNEMEDRELSKYYIELARKFAAERKL